MTLEEFTDGVKATAWLVYDSGKPLPAPPSIDYLPFDDTVLVPDDKMPLLGPVTIP
jgi:iron transport multicopper oxidase